MLKRHKQVFKLGKTEKSFTKDSTILSVDISRDKKLFFLSRFVPT
ncbi:hypothetical protein LEP1GSC038_1122 [Leptospira weilii str. 2006001855]|uniref:Uncharacterized protein n=1 Tax=Leptospira weilii str. 2006001855 TaxID=996804 RepID=M6FKG6_9LEPT|nr:hypothetical protein LEP1GSC038_1122 [Leptospira weilii str. 2006001855]